MEIIGLVKQKVNLVKRDPELEARIIKERGITDPEKQERIKEILYYNHWTVQMFCDITGLATSTVTNLTRPKYNKENELVTELDFGYPFRDLEGDGPKMIVRNAKSEKYLPL
jgi:hypothetical protein